MLPYGKVKFTDFSVESGLDHLKCLHEVFAFTENNFVILWQSEIQY